MSNEPLADILRSIQLSGCTFFQVKLSAPFAVSAMDTQTMLATFAPGAEHMMPFHMVTAGQVWFEVPGGPRVHAETDDVVLFPRGTNHLLTDLPGSVPVEVGALAHEIAGDPPTLVHGGGGPKAEALCGFFHCRGRLFNPLMEALPHVLLVRRDAERTPWLVQTMWRVFSESQSSRAGAAVLVQRLIESLFVEVLQRHLEASDGGGWLGGVHDPVVGPALALIHGAPEKPWTLDELARRSAASRASLSKKFRDAVGVAPMSYLAAWRMEMGARLLIDTTCSVAEVATQIGYGSEAAFSKAFRRHVGEAPATWRRHRRGAL